MKQHITTTKVRIHSVLWTVEQAYAVSCWSCLKQFSLICTRTHAHTYANMPIQRYVQYTYVMLSSSLKKVLLFISLQCHVIERMQSTIKLWAYKISYLQSNISSVIMRVFFSLSRKIIRISIVQWMFTTLKFKVGRKGACTLHKRINEPVWLPLVSPFVFSRPFGPYYEYLNM